MIPIQVEERLQATGVDVDIVMFSELSFGAFSNAIGVTLLATLLNQPSINMSCLCIATEHHLFPLTTLR